MTDYDKVLADNLTILRHVSGMTQEQLADKVGVSQNLINKLENNQVRLKASVIVKICHALDVSVEDLFHQGKQIITGDRLRDRRYIRLIKKIMKISPENLPAVNKLLSSVIVDE